VLLVSVGYSKFLDILTILKIYLFTSLQNTNLQFLITDNINSFLRFLFLKQKTDSMNFSIVLTNLLLGLSLTLSNADGPADWVNDRLKEGIAFHGMGDEVDNEERHLSGGILHQDFSDFVGTWYNCMHTSLMTFGGENAPKHVVEQVGCDGGELGTITRVGNNDQSLQMDVLLLNHCFFHDLGGEGEPDCPDDLLDSDVRGPGNVLVKYQFLGIGSFAEPDKIDMISDHTFMRNSTGGWSANNERAKIENMDTMTCKKYLDGIVCDWRVNEYRTSTEETEDGCKKKGKCKSNWDRKKCARNKGKWTEECGKVEQTQDGFVYDSFGSYYLVKDLSQCHVECATSAPTVTGQTKAPELKVPGCYTGGRCKGCHGCCDCGMTEAECDDSSSGMGGLWQDDGCRPICSTPDPASACFGGPSF